MLLCSYCYSHCLVISMFLEISYACELLFWMAGGRLLPPQTPCPPSRSFFATPPHSLLHTQVYFNESVEAAKKVVDECLGKWDSLLASLPDAERGKLQVCAVNCMGRVQYN